MQTILFPLIFIAVGVVFLALGIPLLRGRISPNPTYGFRTAKTLSDERVWYAVNRVCGKDMVVAGIVVIVASLALFASRGAIATELIPRIMTAVVLLSVLVVFIHCSSVLRRM
jgi:uncharacterized membrane protein